MKHMRSAGDSELQQKICAIQKDIREKEEKLEGLEAPSQALVIKERKSSDELHEAQGELINVRVLLKHMIGSFLIFVTWNPNRVLFLPMQHLYWT